MRSVGLATAKTRYIWSPGQGRSPIGRGVIWCIGGQRRPTTARGRTQQPLDCAHAEWPLHLRGRRRVPAEVAKVAERHGLTITYVANACIQTPRGSRFRMQVVAGTFNVPNCGPQNDEGPARGPSTPAPPCAVHCFVGVACSSALLIKLLDNHPQRD